MPYRRGKSPYWWVNKSYEGIGRIQVSTKSESKKVATAMETTLDRLWSSGKGKFLRDLSDGLFSLPWLYTKDLAGELEQMVSSTGLRPIADIIEWVKLNKSYTEMTKRSYVSCVNQLLKFAPNAVVQDVGTVMLKYRDHCESHGMKRTYNQTRALLQAYTSAVEGRYRNLWNSVSNVAPIKYEVDTGVKLSVAEALSLAAGLSQSHGRRYAEMWWTLLLYGFRKSEYTGKWTVYADRVEVAAAKSKQSGITRTIKPLIRVPLFEGDDFLPIDPQRSFQQFHRHLRSMPTNTKKVSPHDARHTYRYWLKLAGIDNDRAELYLGHKPNLKNAATVYTTHSVLPHLKADAERFSTWLRAEKKKWADDVQARDDHYHDPANRDANDDYVERESDTPDEPLYKKE